MPSDRPRSRPRWPRPSERLGEPSRSRTRTVAKDAREDLRKRSGQEVLKGGIPEKYSWFPFDKLPEVRWRSDGFASGTPRARTGWSSRPGRRSPPSQPVILRDQVTLIREDDRQRLGKFVLEAWLAEDLRPPTPEELMKRLGKFLHYVGCLDH